jgi:hypothetical protein
MALIWFECKQCKARHGKAEEQAGSMVFCSCGQGLRVPWSSTIEPPPEPPPQPRRSTPADNRRRDGRHSVRPGYCFNHDNDTTRLTCAACNLPFCRHCLVTFQRKLLCGPCKNFAANDILRTPPPSGLAMAALCIAIVSGGGVLFVSFVCLMNSPISGPFFPLMVMLVCTAGPGAALVFAWLARRQIDSSPDIGGEGFVANAVAIGLAGVLWCLVVCLILCASSLG